VLLVGGLDAEPQLKALKAGAQIVVGTPGRMIDFVESGKLALDKVRVEPCHLPSMSAGSCQGSSHVLTVRQEVILMIHGEV
jgi:hypothetical protein